MFAMNYKKIISFFVLFVLKETLSYKSTHSLEQFNITLLLDELFGKIFQVELDIASDVRESFGFSEYYRMGEFEYDLDHEVEPFENKFIFQDINFYRHKKDNRKTSRISHMSFNFLENKISVTMKKLRITLESELRARYDTPYVTIFTTLNFRNFTLSSTRKSENNNRLSIDISYDNFFIHHYGLGDDIQWSGEKMLFYTEKEKLTPEITPALIPLLRAHVNQNHRFSQGFRTLFTTISKIKTDIVSSYPDILEQHQKYYYYIPQVPFYHFTLNKIRIQGLSNIQSLDVYKKKSFDFTHTLLLKDIRGSTVLDYGSVQGAPEPLEMNFKADYLTISIHKVKDCAHVKAKYYTVNSTMGPLTSRQTTTVMQRIESALVYAIMPAMKAWTLCNIQTPIDNQNISDTCDWNTINEAYKDWIPIKAVKTSTGVELE